MMLHLSLLGFALCDDSACSRKHYLSLASALSDHERYIDLLFTPTMREVASCEEFNENPLDLESLEVLNIHEDDDDRYAEVAYRREDGSWDAVFISDSDTPEEFYAAWLCWDGEAA